MSKYTFGLDNYEIKDTRSRHEDTNYVAVALSVSGKMVGNPQTKSMGDQNNGTYAVGLTFPNVDVPDGGTATMLYYILNAGHKNPADIQAALSAVVQQQMSKADDASSGQSSSDSSGDWKSELEKFARSLIFADCDGPITPPQGRQIVWSSSDLKGVAAGAKVAESQDEPGNDSPMGCGGNSHYIVHFSVKAEADTGHVSHAGGHLDVGHVGGQVRDHRR
jgi:hypothetical protein